MRTTFAAAAVAAISSSSSVEFDPLEVPKFIAGFMYHLTWHHCVIELEQCLIGGDQIVKDVLAVLKDIKSGHFLDGVQDFSKIIWDLPDALSGCEDAEHDIQMLKAYAEQFKDFSHITKEVAENWLIHGKEVKAEIAKTEDDWERTFYF